MSELKQCLTEEEILSKEDALRQFCPVVDAREFSPEIAKVVEVLDGEGFRGTSLAAYLNEMMGDYLLPLRHLLDHVPQAKEVFASWEKELVFVGHEINHRVFLHIKDWSKMEILRISIELQESADRVYSAHDSCWVAENLRKIIENEDSRIALQQRRKR